MDLKDHGDDHIETDLLTAFEHRLYEDREEIRESCRREDAATGTREAAGAVAAGTDGTDTTCGSTLGASAASATSCGTPGTTSIGKSGGLTPSRCA